MRTEARDGLSASDGRDSEGPGARHASPPFTSIDLIAGIPRQIERASHFRHAHRRHRRHHQRYLNVGSSNRFPIRTGEPGNEFGFFACLQWIRLPMDFKACRGSFFALTVHCGRSRLRSGASGKLFRAAVHARHARAEVGLRVNEEVAVEHDLVARDHSAYNGEETFAGRANLDCACLKYTVWSS